jgi:MFS family permease
MGIMNRSLLLIFGALFTWGLGEGMFLFFQPIYLNQWGASPIAIGTIIGISGLATILAQVPAGYYADRFGSRPIIIGIWATGMVSTWIMALANTLPVYVIGFVIYGATMCVIPPLNHYVTSMRGKFSLERSITLTSASFNVGAVIGPILGGIIGDHSGLRMVYYISASIFIISNIIIFQIKPELAHPHTGVEIKSGLFRNSRFMVLMAIILVTTFSLYLPQPLTPNFLQSQRHLSLTTIGRLGSIGYLGNAIFSFLFGGLNAVTGLLAGQAAMVIYTILFWKGDSTILYAVASFFAGGYRLTRNLYPALAHPLVHHSEKGLAFGVVEVTGGLTMMIAPPVAGILFTKDPLLVYMVSLGLIICTLAINYFYLPRLKEIIQDPVITPSME